MYHRTIDEPFVAGMHPEIFEAQLNYLKKYFRVIPLNQMLEEASNNSLQPYSVALTFDDGHEDFYRIAWPLLRKFNFPATLYVTTGFVDGTHWLWPDLLRYILLNSKNEILEIAELNTTLSTEKSVALTSWNTLGDYCLTLKRETRNTFLQDLANKANITIPLQPVAPFNGINWQQVKEMHAQGLDLGSHTITHPILSHLTTEEIHEELQGSAHVLAHHIGQYPAGICYPNGQANDINKQVLEQAQLCNYKYGIVAYNRKISKDEPYLLGRVSAASTLRDFKLNLCRIRKDVSTLY
jgi:peptidoglycan/xylan/chitin deacetylase (PgdA/CDA1 family)